MKKKTITVKKARKGEVGIVSRNGRLELRWRLPGEKQRTKASGLSDTALNRQKCLQTASEMQCDIAFGQFDMSLVKYGLAVDPKSEQPVFQRYSAELFQSYTAHKQKQGSVKGQAVSSKYKPIRNHLSRFGEIENFDDAQRFVDHLSISQNDLTLKGNISLLQACGEWAVKKRFLTESPFKKILKPKVGKAESRRDNPFSQDEIQRFMEAIAPNRYYSHYTDFCHLLFALGLRPSEAIGLQWQHVDLEKGLIVIESALARSESGNSSGKARVRKETKSGSERVLRLPSRLLEIIEERFNNLGSQVKPKDLLFKTPRGNPINDRDFRQRCWKKICAAAEIEYRPPYTCRHSFGRRLYDEGNSPHAVAYAMGHSSPRTSLDAYGHSNYSPELKDPCDLEK